VTPEQLASALTAALQSSHAAGEFSLPEGTELPAVKVERPKSRDHGDWATNIAMQLGKRAGMSPLAFAELLVPHFQKIEGVSAVEIAGPGFINLRLDAASTGQLASAILEAGRAYGQNEALAGQVINIEFVSANPTGPLHIGHTRWAALGDALGRVLSAAGAQVTREYYINDAGNQMNVFAASILARLKGQDVPEGGYPGAYIQDLADEITVSHPAVLELTDEAALPVLRSAGYELQMKDIKDTLADFNVTFDTYFSESTLHDSGAVTEAVERLRAQGHVYDDGGAIWLRTTDFTDDKDRVMIRANGEPTYFAADAAYYLSKRDRGYDQKIYLLGADHHGYIGRLKAIAAAAGDDPQRNIEILIGQLISVNGARLSKRAGNIIELKDLIEWLGADALRYSLARYPADSPMTIDPDILRSRTNDNPVFYVQYAHARSHSASVKAEAAGVTLTNFDPAQLTSAGDESLIATLSQFPTVVAEAAQFREPHRVARYLETLAGTYHSWYADNRITPHADEEITPAHHARRHLNDATTQVLANGLELLGVSAPEKM
jgi:arginyl-tRNA synthetase